jgi:hypothetical protein
VVVADAGCVTVGVRCAREGRGTDGPVRRSEARSVSWPSEVTRACPGEPLAFQNSFRAFLSSQCDITAQPLRQPYKEPTRE